jgi:methylated-DNA-[protein]-cysteine S-methyltransferase
MLITTVDTPDGPFTMLIENQEVLSSGWTDSPEIVLGRVRPAGRPSTADRVDPDDPRVAAVSAAVRSYYRGEVSAIDRVVVRQFGTPLQLQGWARLREIAPGAPLSYTEFAAAIGRPGAVRAAASICARNAPALFVPCHRVLRGDGSLGGFAWGLAVKQALLDNESVVAEIPSRPKLQ